MSLGAEYIYYTGHKLEGSIQIGSEPPNSPFRTFDFVASRRYYIGEHVPPPIARWLLAYGGGVFKRGVDDDPELAFRRELVDLVDLYMVKLGVSSMHLIAVICDTLICEAMEDVEVGLRTDLVESLVESFTRVFSFLVGLEMERGKGGHDA